MKKKVTLKNGEVISYFDLGKGKKTIIFIHSNLSSGLNFKELGILLAQDFRVIIPDLRGSGDSTYYRKINNINDYSEDLKLFMEKLEIAKASIVGWAFGGSIGMIFASTNWEMIDKLILINSVPHSGIPRFKRNDKNSEIFGDVFSNYEEFKNKGRVYEDLVNAISGSNKEYFIEKFNSLNYSLRKYSLPDNEELINEIFKQRSFLDNIWAMMNFNMSHQHNFYSPGTNTINNIHSNVLHIWGEEDKVIPEYMVLQNLYALKDISNYIKYDNCGHNPMLDRIDNLYMDLKDFIIE